MDKEDQIFVAGHSGMVGAALVRILKKSGYQNIITRDRNDLDLCVQSQVNDFFSSIRPKYVLLAAGKTGGVFSNNAYRADYIYENLAIQCNVLHSAFINEVHKLVYFGCSSIYPKSCSQPFQEEMILEGALEKTSEPFAVSKIAGIKMCESYNAQYGTDFFSVIPTNVYGCGQKYDGIHSALIPCLIESIASAKEDSSPCVRLLGSETPKRDFLYVDDLAEASLFLLENFEGNLLLNIGTGKEYMVREVADIVAEVLDYEGDLIFQATLPEGIDSKLQSIEKIRDLGWEHRIELRQGIKYCCDEFLRINKKKHINH